MKGKVAMSKPNLLIILSDQHSPHVMGCAGDPFVRTPNIDGLAEAGVRFSNTYCGSPLCAPSRMSFLTAQFPSDIEVWTNPCPLSTNTPTFAHALSLAGYETVLCGRMHFTDHDQHHGFERRLVGDVSGAVTGMPSEGMFEGVIPRTTVGQNYLTMEAVGAGRCTYTEYDDAVTRRAVQFLQERAKSGGGRPFCLVVGYLLPHCPYICPKPLFDEYMQKVTLPTVSESYVEHLHPAMKHWRAARGVDKIAAEQARAARAAYYGMVTYLDERIGDVLGALNEAGYGNDTAVSYLSDHGEMAGEHGIWWKESFYEGSVGVPMIWSWPERFERGTVRDGVASLLDVGPTCIDLAGARELPFARGRSLLSALAKGSSDDALDARPAFAEMYPPEQGMPVSRMIRKGPWKLNVYHGYGTPQLFNLDEDPGELNDLGESGSVASIRRELLDQVHDGWDPERIKTVVERRKIEREFTLDWRRSIRTKESERWPFPKGCNEFVGTGMEGSQ